MIESKGAARRMLERQLWALALLSCACGGRSTSAEGRGSAGGASAAGAFGGAVAPGAGNGGAKVVSPAAGNSGSVGANAGASSQAGASALGGAGGSGGYGFVQCPPGQLTRLTGIVRDPAGRVPVYNALAYIPSGTFAFLPEGASCETCLDSSVAALALAFTDEQGHFELEAPAGVNVPLVMQIGKWRRRVVLPVVEACADNALTDPELTRLPRKQSEGTMPRMAVTSGQADSMPCFLRRIGVADEEFTTSQGAGHVHVFASCDAAPAVGAFAASLGSAIFPAAGDLYQSYDALLQYDAVLLGCDDGLCPEQYALYADNIQRYADSGGRLFLNHRQAAWLERGPMAWRGWVSPTQTPGVAPEPLTAQVDVNFPKGHALANWLLGTGASSEHGKLLLHGAALSYSGTTFDRRLLYADENSTPSVPQTLLTLALPTPRGTADQSCGRVTFNDFHIDNPAHPDQAAPFPDGCADTPLSPQEQLLEFLLFDRAACVQGTSSPPTRPRP